VGYLLRLKQRERFIDWLEPMHEIAIEKTGLNNFGEDKFYMLGLRKLLEPPDERSDLQIPISYTLKLFFMLAQRLKTE